MNLQKRYYIEILIISPSPTLTLYQFTVTHRLKLGVMKAIKEDCNMAKLHTTLRQIYEQYHYSPKALRELHLITEALEEKVLKLSNLHGSQCLPYVHRATKVSDESFSAVSQNFNGNQNKHI